MAPRQKRKDGGGPNGPPRAAMENGIKVQTRENYSRLRPSTRRSAGGAMVRRAAGGLVIQHGGRR